MTPIDRLRALHAAASEAQEHTQYLDHGDDEDCSVCDNAERSWDESDLANHNAMPSLLACVDALRAVAPDHPALAPLLEERDAN